MSDLDYQSERDPIFWWRGFPIRAAGLLVIIHTACLLICTFLYAAKQEAVLDLVEFTTTDFLRGFIYTPFTYGFVHLPNPLSVFNFAVEMILLWSFGSQVEHFFGKRLFLRLYAFLWFLTPLILLAFHWYRPGFSLGAGAVHLGIFIAFAAIYPSVSLFFGLPAFWLAVILVAIYTIIGVAARDLVGLISLWVTVAAAWYYVAWFRGELTLQLPAFLRPKPKFRVLPKPQPLRRAAATVVRDAAMDDVDDLLDKIARTGLSSLSVEERARLERASADLKRNR